VFFFAPLPKEEVEPVELPEPFTRPDADELRTQGFVDAGPFLEVEGGGDVVLGHSMRGLFTALAVTRPVRFVGAYHPGAAQLGDPTVAYLGDGSVVESNSKMVTTDNDERFIVRASSFPISDGDPLPMVGGAARPRILLSVEDTDGAVHRATVTPDGHGWIDPNPMYEGTVYDEWTGEVLDTSDAVPLASLNPAWAQIMFTGCSEGLCSGSYRLAGHSLEPPFSGMLTCESATTLHLHLGSTTLQFEWADTGYGGNPQFECDPHWVQPGDKIGPNLHYSITAYDKSGHQISLGIARAGWLYAGDFAPTIGCPCRHGN
jgi:hypothetical protein